MEKKMKQFAVWEIDSNDEGSGYWCLYDSLEDAVLSHGDGAEVYRMEAKFAGRFKRKAVLQRMKAKKKAKARKRA